MFKKILLSLIIAFYFVVAGYAQETLSSTFRKYGAGGSTTIFDYKNKKWLYSDAADAKIAMQPASTFKIINLLIALESGAIKDEQEIIPWPGKTDTTLYGYRPEIYKDLSVKQAFEVSAGWAFIEIAKRIKRPVYLDYLKRSGYGNLDLSEKGADFWNFGPMKISPENQIRFLVKLYEGKTPFSKRNTEILKNVMVTEKSGNYILRSKTGWTRTEGQDIGWWVGYLVNKDRPYFFATRLTQALGKPNANFGKWRKEITKEILKGLQALE
ncbi:penicillin binding protein transpeptidase domain-containing protein [Pedobacter sp. KBW06]|uniref:penicillin-binding transpeptidase domain-containing protein n=1 Tax=Pedobacter sp. KBW06 TaxID=2153359 RepID=UPI000F5A7958|nr:penicillin-binding transpeptidase domain-containing protein [Pedobacter sp. KBW06]RQO74803.1 penicillin binding protein transpeptidase domain-containing protein [Pedobacter sp. KBW06]